MNNVELYCCYSLNLRKFLEKNELRYKLAALNPNSKSLFWVYIKDEKLDRLLNEWSANKKAISNS
jgi:hypothetical protein